ncbi:MAG: hypothetical protein LBJ96_05025 [Holosporaceae bacterium]|jgi:hypothetical protein|nr:hypothetical protein [Holosporaceae bacterium]
MKVKKMLCATVVAMFVGITVDVGGMLHPVVPGTFGKMNDGLTYTEANDQHLPQAVAAQQLANRLLGNDISPGMGVDSKITRVFNAALAKTGMDAEELAFELLNWPDSPIAAKQCSLQPLLGQNWTALKIVREVLMRIEAAASQISERNAWTRGARERAIVMSIDRLRDIDYAIIDILGRLNEKIALVNNSADNLREKLCRKIAIIDAAKDELAAVDHTVDFGRFLNQEVGRAVARTQSLSRGLPASIDSYQSKIKLRDETGGRESAAVDLAHATKQILIQAINAHIIAVRGEIILFANDERTSQEDLISLYSDLGLLIYDQSTKTGMSTPKDLFEIYGLPASIIGRFSRDGKRDEEFEWKMYWSLPSEITDRSSGDRDDEYKIPMPAPISDPMRRSVLGIPRTSAITSVKDDAWGLGKIDDHIW